MSNNKHNSAATTYYLLLKKFLKEGGKSPADLTSENFKSIPTNLKPELKKVETMPVPENKIIIN